MSPAEEKSPPEKESSKTLSLSSITSALPSMPWSPPAHDTHSPQKNPTSPLPTPATTVPPLAPAAPTRKLTSPFAWLSRNSTQKDAAATSPPPSASPRRNTASSVATLTSNPEMMLSKLEEEKDGRANGAGGSTRNSLKDRFKLIRMREEAGIAAAIQSEEEKAAGAVAGDGVVSPTGLTVDEKEHGLGVQPPLSPIPTSPNPGLAPGTASGVSAGPSTISDVPVDWDLWQSVISEGPAAVARTSADELNKAIATGIPSAIRGVIWQVLAQSKNEELEVVYKELVARGADKEKDRNSNGSASLSSGGSLSIQKEPISSASSIHSENSGPNGASSPTEKESEAAVKAQAQAAVERKRRVK